MENKQLFAMLGIFIVLGIGNKIAHEFYRWTWFDSIAPFIPIIILGVVWFVKNQNDNV
jgi:bacteriorhodopsin